MNDLDKLISRIKQLRTDSEEITKLPTLEYPAWTKLKAGDSIRIEWEHLDDVDIGYVFLLPGHEEHHEIDALLTEGVVHIPYPVGGQKQQDEPEWITLPDLLTNPMVKSIFVLGLGHLYFKGKTQGRK